MALGDAHINIEDLALHHMSAELGGTLTIFVLGEDVCRRTGHLLTGLGYDTMTAGGRVTGAGQASGARRATVVAIDGPSGSGKSSVARAVADRLGLVYLDTGAMYRAVGLLAREAGISPDDDTAVTALAARARLRFDDGAACSPASAT